MSAPFLVLRDRRAALLRALSVSDLAGMHRRVTGGMQPFKTAAGMRELFLREWDTYADEIKRWTDFTITGESVL